MLKIWGRPTSICTQRVLWCLEEANLKYELTLASGTMGPHGHISKGGDAFGGVNTSEYLRMNPNGRIPTISDGDFTLWESNAIVAYLALTYAPYLYEEDIRIFARASAWMSWSNQYLDPPLTDLVLHLVRLPEGQRSQVVVSKWNDEMVKYLKILDRHLSDSPYVGGGSFGIAECAMASNVYRWALFSLPSPELPNVRRWLTELGERPAFRKIVQPHAYHLNG